MVHFPQIATSSRVNRHWVAIATLASFAGLLAQASPGVANELNEASVLQSEAKYGGYLPVTPASLETSTPATTTPEAVPIYVPLPLADEPVAPAATLPPSSNGLPSTPLSEPVADAALPIDPGLPSIAGALATPHSAPGLVAEAESEPSLALPPVEPGVASPPALAQAPVTSLDTPPSNRPTSYIAAAGNIPLSGDESAIGDGGFAIVGKIGFTDHLAIRPGVFFGDGTVLTAQVSYGFPVRDAATQRIRFTPYVGAGLAVTTGSGSDVGPMVSGGVDVPLTEQLTATGQLNVAFLDDTDIGLLLGLGYTFSLF